jgi:hypothetical protein
MDVRLPARGDREAELRERRLRQVAAYIDVHKKVDAVEIVNVIKPVF